MTRKIFAIVVALCFMGAAAFAQGKGQHGAGPKEMKGGEMGCPMMQGHGMMGMGMMNIDNLKQQLKLTDEQVNKINALHLNHKKEMLKYEEVLAPQEIKLHRLLLEDTVNLDEVKALITDIYKTKGEMHVEKVKHILDVEQILTPEQRVKFKAMHGKCQMGMGGKMKMGEKMKMKK